MWNLVAVYLETVLVSVQDSWTVCAKHTKHSEIDLDAPDGTPRRLKWKLVSFHLEMVLILPQDRCTVCAERTIGSKIILDAPGGTPR
jgi:ABC-type antimicrobial peptide transport system ATPase subunit